MFVLVVDIHLKICMFNLFYFSCRYGVKEITQKGEKIFISLSYSPRSTTLKRKFGNLPIRYMRAKLEKEEDFRVLEKVVKRFQFNLLDDEATDLPQRRLDYPSSNKRKLYLEPPTIEEWQEEDDAHEEEITKLLNLPSMASSSQAKRRNLLPSPTTAASTSVCSTETAPAAATEDYELNILTSPLQ